MSKFVAVEVEGVVEIHLPDASGNYATLCGLDGDDSHTGVQQALAKVPKGATVNCDACWNIFKVCRDYTARDFERGR